MANKILVARGTKARIEEIKGTLAVNELVYSTDTGELGVKKANGNIEYFKNATDIDAIEGEVIQLQTDIADKVDKVAGKGLSTNDYTNAEKTKLAGIEQGAEKNTVNSVNGKTGAVVINKSDVGLPNADDTSDLDKPISTATQSALNLKADKTQLNNYVTTSTFDMQMLEKLGIKPNGTDLLIIDGMINPLYIDDTSYKVNHPTVNSQAEMLALDVPPGTVVVRLDTPSKELFLLTQLPASTLANWQLVSSNTVVSVAGKTGAVVLGITDISGLTSALNLKLDITTFESQITQLQDDIDSKADKSELFSKNYNDLTNKPSFATVATTGSYNDLTNKPSIPSIPSVMSTTEGNAGTATTQRTINAKNLKDIVLNHSPAGARPASDVSAWAKASSKPTYTAAEVGARPDNWTPSWSQVSGKPSFATVATSGSYNDLSNKPTIPTIPSVMTTTEGNTGTATTQRTINAKNLKDIILNHSPAGARPASDVSAWAKKSSLDAGDVPNLNASKINAGTFDAARIPNLAAGKITSGRLIKDRLPTDTVYTADLATVAISGNYNHLSNRPTIPSIPSVMTTAEGNTGTSTTQRTINAANLKSIILNHSPAGARPASDVKSWAKANTLEEALKNLDDI